MVYHCFTLFCLPWVVPPPSNSGNEGLVRDSLLKMVHNPGGDSYWEGGQPNVYICLPIKKTWWSGQIIATSHEFFTPNGGLVREIPLFQGNPGW